MRRVIPLVAVVAMTGCADTSVESRTDRASLRAVVRVSDGDTVVLSGLGRTRLIGIDAPELGDCFGQTAKALLTRLLDDRSLLIRPGAERRDRHGRPLVYATLTDGRPLAELLVERGWARPLVIPPNDDGAPQRAELADRARAARRGLWGRCSSLPRRYVFRERC